MNRHLRWLFVGIILLILAISVLYQINETQVGVLTQFGRPVAVIAQAGLHAKLPFPIQQIHKQDGRLLTFDPPAEEFLTLDKKNLIVDAFLLWQVKDPVKYLVSVGNRSGAEARLADLLYSALGSELGKAPFSALISDIPGEMRLDSICHAIERTCRQPALDNFGIEVRRAMIKRLYYPPQNRTAVFERMKAERGRIARQYRSEGEEEAQKIRSAADLESALILAQANQEALTIQGQSEAQAADIYRTAIQKDAEFYKFLRSLDAYKAFLDDRTTVVLPNDSELLEVLRKGSP